MFYRAISCHINDIICRVLNFDDIIFIVYVQSRERSKPVTRVEAFVKTHTKKNGEPVTAKDAEVLVIKFQYILILILFFLLKEFVI